MKRIFISLLAVLFVTISCVSNQQTAIQQHSEDSLYLDTLAISLGKLLAVDCYLSNLSDYSDQIGKAVDDVYAGRIGNIYQAYEYVNAVDMVSKSYSQLMPDMNPELIKNVAYEIIERAKDSISKEELRSIEREANEYIVSYFDSKFINETKKFMNDVDHIEGVEKTESGLRYQIINQGEGKISNTDKVDVTYTLYDYNDKIIDSSKGKPFNVQLPSGVVPGFAQGIQLVGVGGKVKIWVPADLGYGDEGAAPAIAPGQTLVFVIEVIKKY